MMMDFEQLNQNLVEELECMNRKKNYYCCLKEITRQELFDGLLGYGLFADKIPPFLTSENFLYFCKDTSNTTGFSKKKKNYIHYESMRNINVPRVFAIPEPVAYYYQCKILSDYWDDLLKYFHEKTKLHTHKVSRIHIRKIDGALEIMSSCYDNLYDIDLDDIDLDDYQSSVQDHLFEMNHTNFCKDDYPEPKLLIGKNYLVKADISNYFPSIYTHSIPWALVGKKVAKLKSTPLYSGEWFNKIDEYTRKVKEDETHGILIGSHSSNLISEIILVAVDDELWKKEYKYIRKVDDYICYVNNQEDAEQFLVDLSSELKKYGLTLNHKKTKIEKLPKASRESWVRKLNSFVFPHSEDDKLKLKEVRAYLDIALELMFNNKENSAILNYAIQVLSKKPMSKGAKEYFTNTAHHLVILYPYLIPILDKKIFEIFKIDTNRIKRISLDIFELGNKRKLFEAMSYALFFSLKYNFLLKEELFEKVEYSNDTILLLLAYLHDEKFINHSKVRKKYKILAKSLLSDIDEYWVFVYEVLKKSDLKDHWSIMKDKKVSFLKDDFKVGKK